MITTVLIFIAGGLVTWFIFRFIPERVDYARQIKDQNKILLLEGTVKEAEERRKKLAGYTHEYMKKNFALQNKVNSYNKNLIATHQQLAQTEELKDELLSENINLIDMLKKLAVDDNEINRACRTTLELRAAV